MFDPQRTALHFSMPLDELDWTNLRTSGVRLVQLPWAQALYRDATKRTQLDLLTAAGYGVILRMRLQDALDLGMSRDRLRAALQERLGATNGQGLEGVIAFNEPDIAGDGKPFDLTKGSPSWHQAEARLHAYDTSVITGAIGDTVRVCAAPLTNRHQSEDGKPEPGLMEWWTELRPAYHAPGVKAVGVHIYEQFLNDDPASIDTGRMKHKLWLWGTFWQPALWIDEFNVTHGTPVERARAWCAAIRYLRACPEDVQLFSPFVSNGDGKAYPPDLIVRDTAAYAQLRTVVSPGR